MPAVFVLLAVLTVIYPFIVYTSLEAWGPGTLAMGLLVILTVRVLLRRDFRQPEQYLQLVLVGGLCVLAAWFQSEDLLRYYPVAMSLAFSGFFAVSLRSDTSMIERFANWSGDQEFETHQRRYMRQLTKVWALVLLLNASVAAYTACCMSLASWTVYNGLIAYIVLGVLGFGELVYRHFYRKKMAGFDSL